MSKPSTKELARELEPRMTAAYHRVAPELVAVPASSLLVVNVHIPTVVPKVLALLPGIRELRSGLVDELPRLDVARFDRLEDHLLAMGHAHVLYREAGTPKATWTENHVFARELRDRFFVFAIRLVQLDVLPREALASVSGMTRFDDVTEDLATLESTFRREWARVVPHTPLVAAELERAATLVASMRETRRRRDEAPRTFEDASAARMRAFTLFLETYDLARRAASHLRWREGDADAIAPWLHPTRTKPRTLGEGRKNDSCLPTRSAAA